jgi:hypothetical protein
MNYYVAQYAAVAEAARRLHMCHVFRIINSPSSCNSGCECVCVVGVYAARAYGTRTQIGDLVLCAWPCFLTALEISCYLFFFEALFIWSQSQRFVARRHDAN